MPLETIRDANNCVTGYLAMDDCGNGIARDAHMTLLGRYSVERDFTYDAHNFPFARGNQLPALIYRSAE